MLPHFASEQQQRVYFLVFVKVLFCLLDKSEDTLLREQAKLIVYRCRQSPSQHPLRQRLREELRELVGDSTWEKAKNYTSFFIKEKDSIKKQQRIRSALVELRSGNKMLENSNLNPAVFAGQTVHQV